MKATAATASRREALMDWVLGYTGLLLIGAMAWTCDRLGLGRQAPEVPATMPPLARGARS